MTAELDPVEALYASVVDELSLYDGGLTGLGRLVGRLESLVEQIEEREGGDRARALRRQWGQLEILYALALDSGRAQLTDDEERDVAEMIGGLLRECSKSTAQPDRGSG